MMNFKGTRNAFLAGLMSAAMMLNGCGKTPADIQNSLTAAVTAIETNDTSNFASAIKTIKSDAEKIKDKAEKEGNTEDSYLADFMNELCLALEDLNEAEIGITGVRGADHAKVIQYIKDIKNDKSDPNNQITPYQEEKAAEFAEQIIQDYLKAIGYLNSSGEHMYIAVKAAGDDTYKDTIDRTTTIAKAIEAEIDTYSDDIQEIFDLSPEQMEALKTVSAVQKEEFENALEEISGSSADSVKGKGNSIKQNLNEFIGNFKQGVQSRWDEVRKKVALLAEKAKVGAELRAKEAERKGYEVRLKTGDAKGKIDARNNINQLDEDIEALMEKYEAVSNAKDVSEYKQWLIDNGYTTNPEVVQSEVIAPETEASGESIIPPFYPDEINGRD